MYWQGLMKSGAALMLWNDATYAARSLYRRPGVTAISIAVLSVAIATNVAIFGVIEPLLFEAPGRISQPERVVVLSGNGLRPTVYQDIVSGVTALSVGARSGILDRTLGGGDDAELVRVDYVDSSFFNVVGVAPFLGRAFTSADDDATEDGLAIVLSYGTWQRRFGGASVLGTAIEVSNESYVIVGVMPEEFRGVDVENTDIWLPAGAVASSWSGRNWIHLVGRLSEDSALAAAESELRLILDSASPNGQLVDGSGAPISIWESSRLRPLKESWQSRLVRLDLMILAAIGAGASLLVVGIANFTGLLISRSARRRNELALQVSLGASPTRIGARVVIESVLVGLVSSCLCLLFAYWTIPLLREVFELPRIGESTVGERTIVFSFTVAFCCSVLSSAPLWLLLPKMQSQFASQASFRPDGSILRFRSGLVAVQTAFSVLALLAGGLFVRSLNNAMSLPFGISADRVIELGGPLERAGFSEAEVHDTYRRILERVILLPNVRAASSTLWYPYVGAKQISWTASGYESPYFSADNPTGTNNPSVNAVGPDYFSILEMRTIEGRLFTEADTGSSELVAVVNEKMARDVWSGDSPIGKCLLLRTRGDCHRIVGVVNSIRSSIWRPNGAQLDAVDPAFYVPVRQWAESESAPEGLLIKMNDVSSAALVQLRQTVQGTDSRLPFMNMAFLSDRLLTLTGDWRRAVIVLGALSGMALFLTVVAMYASLTFSVQERTREFGVRLALGATPRMLFRLAVLSGIRPVIAGSLIGLIASQGLLLLLSSLLFGVTPTDPLTIVGVVGIVICASVIACYLPAMRAARTDPCRSLRCE